jgi:hypothetical protein
MSDEYLNDEDDDDDADVYEEIDSDEELEELESDEEMEAAGEEEYEEISSDEVDRVVASLEELIESTTSDNIRTHLEETMNAVFYLVYDENDLEDEEDGLSAEAA